MKRIGPAFFLALVAIVFCACSQHNLGTFVLTSPSPVLDRIQQRGELVVATAAGMPPLNMTTRDGKIIGLDADLSRFLADAMEVSLRLEPMAFSDLLPALEAGKVDMVISGVTDNRSPQPPRGLRRPLFDLRKRTTDPRSPPCRH
ncbi:MAG: transporter substrate-binding domain-containing protein [Deltaproteobacteria bacterium]|nr:transporter substrate-binding domain-containing protein [Deltaproteobacteria bacterium]